LIQPEDNHEEHEAHEGKRKGREFLRVDNGDVLWYIFTMQNRLLLKTPATLNKTKKDKFNGAGSGLRGRARE
jgi:hypothetical protein